MRSTCERFLFIVVSLVLLASVALAQPQPGGPPPGPPPEGGPEMGMDNPMAEFMGLGMLGGLFGGGGQPQPVMLVADGIIYVACDGTLTAFDAKTLGKIATAVYWERPRPPMGMMGPGGPPGGFPGAPPPAPGAGGPAPQD